MSLKFATAYPERVSKLVLIASAGLAEVRHQFISNVAQIRQEDGTAPVNSAIIGENDIPKEVLDFMNLIVASYNPIQHLPVYTDEQLQQLTCRFFLLTEKMMLSLMQVNRHKGFPV
ncbi:MAG: hypothetical protein IPK16_18645 [Anaerolineales bacterium]|nr:hypothetical protein [Anaerolineales bacterium]